MGMKISEIITDKYKLRIPPTVYYELLADVQELEEEQEPTTKNDLVTLTFSKGILKYSCKDYVVYKRDWLRSHYGAEIDIMFGDSQYKEPTTKNDLGVDAVSRQVAIDAVRRIHPVDTVYDCTLLDKDDVMYVLNDLPSVTPQEPKTGRWIDNKCTNCGYEVQPWNTTNYCPNCGAFCGGDNNG